MTSKPRACYNSVMPEGNLLGRITAFAILVAAVVWVGRFTGGMAFCRFCEPKASAAPAATETQEAAPAPKAAVPAAAPKSTGTTPSSPKTEKK